ncbi:uncharacterized protein LOC112462933, partial [Temnothorax curvispinosus]|uniref:Uncharacterized protein LOC112462933 n=1 Tax=Temnothorax curvispinosus TaxID=300111 RepID=A0A6J1QQP7_9HYME
MKFQWDEPLPSQLSSRWLIIRKELTSLIKLSIPRWYNQGSTSQTTWSTSSVEFHGFSDTSQLAMAAVVFITVHGSNGTTISLVCSKTKVAPLKRLTIPRLELTAALLLSRLMQYVQATLKLNVTATHLWTDSVVTLTWIKSHASRWKDFVRNRVSQIQELTANAHWNTYQRRRKTLDLHSALEEARFFWIKATQAAYFTHEIEMLTANSRLPTAHAFSRLTAYIDAQGIIRVGGRLNQSALDQDNQHQAILPRHFSTLIIAHAHLRTLTRGTQLTLAHVRQGYWIIGGRAPAQRSAHYLQRQQAISKWHHPNNNIKMGSIVLLTDERSPPCKWPLTRVPALHPGKDGLTRVVTLKTATTTLNRPSAKLAILPISTKGRIK